MKSVELDNCDTITAIRNDSIKKECNNIGNEKKWKKSCPKCGKEQVYSKRWIFVRALSADKWCVDCARSRIPKPVGGWMKLCPLCSKEMQYTSRDHFVYSIKRKCLCKSCSNSNSPRRGGKGRPKTLVDTDETRRKKRLGRIAYLQSCFGMQIAPTYNKLSCEYFDCLNKWNNWHGQYATNGGEFFIKTLGYWVDYYESTENIVVEWDEPSHYRKGRLLDSDVNRMKEIKNLLKCKFFRYNQKTNELKEW